MNTIFLASTHRMYERPSYFRFVAETVGAYLDKNGWVRDAVTATDRVQDVYLFYHYAIHEYNRTRLVLNDNQFNVIYAE